MTVDLAVLSIALWCHTMPISEADLRVKGTHRSFNLPFQIESSLILRDDYSANCRLRTHGVDAGHCSSLIRTLPRRLNCPNGKPCDRIVSLLARAPDNQTRVAKMTLEASWVARNSLEGDSLSCQRILISSNSASRPWSITVCWTIQTMGLSGVV